MGNYWTATIAALALGAGAIATTANADPRELSFATYIPANSSFIVDDLIPWTEWVNERANGEFKIKVYAGGTLSRDPNQQHKVVRDGIADMAAVVPARSPGEFPNYAIFELPGFARSAADGTQAAWEMYKEGTLGESDTIKIISIWMAEPSIVFSTGKIESLDDLADQRLRVAGGTQTETLLALDAIPQPVKTSEVAEAISRGMLDGAVVDWAVADIFRVPEVTEYVYNIPLGALPFLLAMNNDTYDSLSDDAKALFAEAGDEWARRQGAYFGGEAKKVRSALESDGKHTVIDASDDEIAQLLEKTKAVREDVRSRVAPNLIEAYRDKLDEIHTAK